MTNSNTLYAYLLGLLPTPSRRRTTTFIPQCGVLTLLLCVATLVPVVAVAQTGFTDDGIVTTAIGSSIDEGYAVAVQDDDKILVAGYHFNGSGNFALARYEADGTLDATFSNDGITFTNLGASASASAVAVQSDGKILVTGYVEHEQNRDIALVRYNPDGSLDETFGGDGFVTTAVGSGNDNGQSVAVQRDGKILVTGYFDNGSNDDIVLMRYNPDGSLDESFGEDGITTTDIDDENDNSYSVALQSDDKILVAGSAHQSTTKVALVRYTPDGMPDSTFSDDGFVTSDIGPHRDNGRSLTIQNDGKILVTGSAFISGNLHDIALVRYNPDGSLDETFGGDGFVTTAVGSGNDNGQSVAVQRDGKILVTGYFDNGSNDDIALVRYNPDGSLDETFGEDGITMAPGATNDYGRSVALQSDGGILVAGTSDGDILLARFDTEGALDENFAEGGITTTNINSGFSIGKAAAMQNDGKILVAGASRSGTNFDFTLVRYHSDGILDRSFNEDGIITTDIDQGGESAESVAVQSDGRIVIGGTYFDTDFDIALVRYSVNGFLDATFGDDGVAIISSDSSWEFASSIAVLDDDKTLIVGSTMGLRDHDIGIVLARFNVDGTLDETFADDGIAITATESWDYYGNSVAVDDDGRILVAGHSTDGSNEELILVRYTIDGALDEAFADGGIAATNPGPGPDIGSAVATQDDGGILVAGHSEVNDSRREIVLVRYKPDGALDEMFGEGGITTTDVGSPSGWGRSLALQNDGKILVAGMSDNGSDTDIALVRYNPDGTLDTSFSDDGFTTTAIESRDDDGNSVTVEDDGRIFVAGKSGSDFVLVRYDTDGTLLSVRKTPDAVDVPGAYQLSQAYPNPSSNTARLTLTVVRAQDVTVTVYDVLGRRVAELHNGRLEASAAHAFTFDGKELPNGLFVVRVTGETFTAARTVSLVR